MANITSKTELAETPADGDYLYLVDVSDTTDNANGSDKKVTRANLVGGLSAVGHTHVEADITDLGTYQEVLLEGAFVDGDKTKLDGIATGATANVGDVVGPASATDNAIVRFNGTTGKSVQNSSVTIADNGDVTLGANDFLFVDNIEASSAGTSLVLYGKTVSSAGDAPGIVLSGGLNGSTGAGGDIKVNPGDSTGGADGKLKIKGPSSGYVGFDVSALNTTDRTITIPDANVTLGDAISINGDTVDNTAKSNGRIMQYNSGTGNIEWVTLSGGGDMLASTYDPTSVAGDAFDQDNMVDGTTNKNYTATEKTKLSGIEAGAQVNTVTLTNTATLTNKRVTPRTGTTTSSATPTINTDNVDFYSLTAQTVDITSFTTNLSGTPTDGQKLWIAITGTGARAITWGSSFEASTVALPTTTVSTNRLDVGFVWNAATSKWRCVAVA